VRGLRPLPIAPGLHLTPDAWRPGASPRWRLASLRSGLRLARRLRLTASPLAPARSAASRQVTNTLAKEVLTAPGQEVEVIATTARELGGAHSPAARQRSLGGGLCLRA
jgi:hypothetical protein